MAWMSALAIGGSALLNSKASSSAASAGNAANQAAIDEQRRQYDLNRADQSQFLNTGTAANQKLAQLLGLTKVETSDALRSKLLSKYTTNGSSSTSSPSNQQLLTNSLDPLNIAGKSSSNIGANVSDPFNLFGSYNQQTSTPSSVDEAGLSKEIADTIAQEQAATGSSDYGSLLKKFSTSDLNADPVYQSGLQFGLDQGTGAINARAVQSGGYDSGATLKALTKYANDYGSTKANESYNRYNTDQTNVYNRLAGVSGTGQQAANQVQSAGTTSSGNISNLLNQQGSNTAAGIVGGANAWGTGVQNGINANNNSNNSALLKQLLAQNQGTGSNKVTDPNYYSGY